MQSGMAEQGSMGMRKGNWMAASAAVALVLGTVGTANAVGLGDLAKVVLGGGSILKKGSQKCGSSLALTTKEDLLLSFARSQAQKSLPLAQFTALDQVSSAEAEKASQSPTFCADTVKKKKGLLGSIGSAAKKLAKGRMGI
jgi:hypothetical protein